MIAVEDAPYQECYCEENIYKLFEKFNDRDGLYAVLVSNEEKMVMLWSQKSAKNPVGSVIWDYHVFAVHKTDTGSKVYDIDSTLAWGSEFNEFWSNTMKTVPYRRPERFERKFRVIPANVYLTLLSSDRSHMRNEDGTFQKPPPDWPLINPQLPSNLMRLLEFKNSFEDTTVMDEQQIFSFFST